MFNIRIAELRESHNLTQAKLAKILGVSTSTVAMWESDNRVPPAAMLSNIADHFGVTVDYLLGRTKEDINVLVPASQPADEDIRMIQRARSKMSPQDREKMMKILKASFEEAFDDKQD